MYGLLRCLADFCTLALSSYLSLSPSPLACVSVSTVISIPLRKLDGFILKEDTYRRRQLVRSVRQTTNRPASRDSGKLEHESALTLWPNTAPCSQQQLLSVYALLRSTDNMHTIVYELLKFDTIRNSTLLKSKFSQDWKQHWQRIETRYEYRLSAYTIAYPWFTMAPNSSAIPPQIEGDSLCFFFHNSDFFTILYMQIISPQKGKLFCGH